MREINSRRIPQSPQPQPLIRHEPLVKKAGKDLHPERCLVGITSFRCGRLVDPDNLAGKYFVDALRYSGAIPDDRPEDIIYQITQEKVKTRKEEKTIITLEYEET